MKEVLEDYLDNAPDLDATQKAGIFTATLKDMYKDINSQVLATSLEALKLNSSFELEKYNVEGSYNKALATIVKTEEEVKLVVAQTAKTLKEADVLGEDTAIKAAQVVEIRAKLKKQYGVIEEVVMQLSDDVNDQFRQYTDGVWYKVDANGSFIDLLDVIISDPTIDGVQAVVQTTAITSTLDNTVRPGAIDKQITGYDMVNFKDVLKTLDERTALMQNAKVPETPGEKKMRKELLEVITGATITLDGESNIADVSNILIPCTSACP